MKRIALPAAKRFESAAVAKAGFVIASLAMNGLAAAQPAALNAAQLEGQQLFVQHCGLCHNKIQINVPAPNGPALTKAVFDGGKEAQVKAQIINGSPNMPGYKWMFVPDQIDALVEYIKTLEPKAPAPVAPPANR